MSIVTEKGTTVEYKCCVCHRIIRITVFPLSSNKLVGVEPKGCTTGYWGWSCPECSPWNTEYYLNEEGKSINEARAVS